MQLFLEIQVASKQANLPKPEKFRKWARAALQGQRVLAEMTIRIVDEDESAELNQRYRGKSGATNVLSFPAEDVAHAAPRLLGDLVICAPIVAREAIAQGKTPTAHWAHLVAHGVLHLLGFDHEQEARAMEMEALEVQILAGLDFPNPYIVSAAA